MIAGVLVHPAARLFFRVLEFLFDRRCSPALPAHAYQPLSLNGLGRIERLRLSEAVSANGLRLRAGSEVCLHPDGAIAEATLEDCIEAEGLLFAAGRPVRFFAGLPVAGTLVKAGRYRGILVPEGAEVDLKASCGSAFHALGICAHGAMPHRAYPDVAWTVKPPRRWKVGGILCEAGKMVAFDREGRLSLACLARDARIRGVPCAADTFVVWRRALGSRHLARCVLARDFGGSPRVPLVWKGGTEITFVEDGSIEEGTLAHDAEIDGLPCAAGGRVLLGPGGSLRKALLASDAALDGLRFRAGTEIAVEYGIVRGTLAEPCRIGDVPCAAGPIALRREGSVLSAILSAPARLDGLACARGTRVCLDLGGRLSLFTPRKDVEIDGLLCRGGAEVAFSFDWSAKRPPLRRLARFTVARRAPLKRVWPEIPEGSRISRDVWHDAGEPEFTLELGDKWAFGGVDLPPGSTVRLFWRSVEVSLAAPLPTAAGILPAGSTLVLGPRSGLKGARLGDAASIGGVVYPAGSELAFRSSGLVHAAAPSAPIRIPLGHRPAPASSPYRSDREDANIIVCGAPHLTYPTLFFHASGEVASLVLAAPGRLDGRNLPPLAEAHVDRRGRLRRWSPARL